MRRMPTDARQHRPEPLVAPQCQPDGSDPRTAIQKALRLMEALGTSEGPASLADLADGVGVPRPSAHRLLSQLEAVGFVERDLSGKGYQVGSAWLRLAISALTASARRPPIRDILRGLVDDVGETCNLGVLKDNEVVYIERVECDWPLRLQLQAGSTVPLHCTAVGKLFLSQMKPPVRRKLYPSLRLEPFTINTITDPERLEEECRLVARTGIAINREEYHLGLIGVAVPVRRADELVIAALSIHAPVFRMSIEAAEAHVPRLMAAAERIAHAIQQDA